MGKPYPKSVREEAYKRWVENGNMFDQKSITKTANQMEIERNTVERWKFKYKWEDRLAIESREAADKLVEVRDAMGLMTGLGLLKEGVDDRAYKNIIDALAKLKLDTRPEVNNTINVESAYFKASDELLKAMKPNLYNDKEEEEEEE